jgi:hypothetical protein
MSAKHTEETRRPRWMLSRARWSFLVAFDAAHDSKLHWWWRALAENGTIWEGEQMFRSMIECQADAATHGFEPRSLSTP